MSKYDSPDVMRDDIGPKDGFLNLLNQKLSFKRLYKFWINKFSAKFLFLQGTKGV